MNNNSITKKPQVNPFELLAQATTYEERKAALEKLVRYEANEEEALLHKIQEISDEGKNNPQDETIKARLQEVLSEYLKRTYVSSGLQISSSVHVLDQKAVNEVRQQLKAEFAPVTPSEALMIDQAINAYFRSLRLSQAHINLMQDPKGSVRLWDNQQIINLAKEIGKQANFANQQFITAITYLREAKQPPIKVKVHAKEAFVAQNQQFNKNT